MLAEDHHIESVAFPAISTGAFGFPLKDATEISFRTIKKMIPKLRHIKHIRFVLHDNTALSVYEQLLGKIIIE
jgi:O-acetyl-ADP-ribose deacetylase (regulator of RNase III)